jgi:putative FmdB family regulatory protein
MPTYKYFCDTCKVHSDKISTVADRDKTRCLGCGNLLVRKGPDAIAVHTPLDTSKKDAYTATEIDKVVGESASVKWNTLTKKIEKKLAGAKVVDIGVKPGEVFNPEHHLGSEDRKAKSKIFSKAVAESKSTPEDLTKLGFKKVNI